MNLCVERIRVHPRNSLKEVMSVMDSAGIGIALVVNDVGKLLGIVTDGDVRRALLRGVDLNDKVEDIMTSNPVVLSEDAQSGDAKVLQLLESENFKKRNPRLIPVIDAEGRPKHLVSIEELLNSDPATLLAQGLLSTKHIGQVLVIGGAGYIGSVLVRQLLKAGYQVKVLDLFLYGDDSLKELRDHPAFEFVQGDTRHVDTLVSAIQSASCVVHLAELVGDPLCATNPIITLQINYLSTLAIAQICSYLQVNRFVYVSSCSVYGASTNPEAMLSENSKLSPVSLYAKMKINAEKAILTGLKDEQKAYFVQSRYAGHSRHIAYRKLKEEQPGKIVEKAIKGMLPHNTLGRKMVKKLFVYVGKEHKHQAQKPEPLHI